MNPELVRALVTIMFGALAGGLTNSVAVWMLFHPYVPPRLGRLRLAFLHGAIPKNQERLAAAVGRTVGDRLLTRDDLATILSDQEFRSAFDERLEAFLREVLERERGPLKQILGPDLVAQAEALLHEIGEHLIERLDRWVDSDGLERAVNARVREWMAHVSDRPVAEVLTESHSQAISGFVDRWIAHAVEREGFEQAVEAYVDRVFAGFLRDDRTFADVLPAGLSGSLERALSDYLPIAVQRLGGILEDPGARQRLQRAMQEIFQRFLRDLRFHQRVVARLVVTEEALDRVLATIEEEGAEHLSVMLRDPAVQDATARRVNEAVTDFLHRPVTAVLGRHGDESVLRARDTVAGWVVTMARDQATREFIVEKLGQAMGKAAEGTWGQLLDEVSPDRVTEVVVLAARSEPARRAYREVLGTSVASVLDRPVGRPADMLPEGALGRVQAALSEPLWGWLQGQSAHVVQILDVGRRVEEKVRGYPTAKMEELVRRVTDRELRLIVRLGYVLGGAIGVVLVLMQALIP